MIRVSSVGAVALVWLLVSFAEADQKAPPEDIWAIRCLSTNGPNRHAVVSKYADALRKVKGLKPELVQVIEDRHESQVFYGRYKREYDARKQTASFKPDNLKDLELVRSLSMTVNDPQAGPRDVWPFQLATMAALPTERGEVNAWNLSRAKGYYSLQVGVFYDTEGMRQRRYAAEEYCRLLRSQGEEAYFYHGPAMSIVCLGAFPKEAIADVREEDPLTGKIKFSARIVDSKLLALQEKYPDNLQNGARMYDITHDPRTGEKIRTPQPSFPVQIPSETDEALISP